MHFCVSAVQLFVVLFGVAFVFSSPAPQSPYQVEHFHRDLGDHEAPSNDADRQRSSYSQREQSRRDDSDSDRSSPSTVSLYQEGQQQQQCHDLISRKLGGYNRQTFRAMYVRGDIEESQRGIYLCCVKQYLDPAASSLDYECSNELQKLSSTSEQSSPSRPTPDPFAPAQQQPSSSSSGSNNDVSGYNSADQQEPRSANRAPPPQPYDDVRAASSRGERRNEQSSATNTAGIGISAGYSPARSISGSSNRAQQLPSRDQQPTSPADALLRQISLQFNSPYGGGFPYNNNNDLYGSSALSADPYSSPFSFSFAPAPGGGVLAGRPRTVGGLQHAGDDEPAYPASGDVFGSAPAGVDIVGTNTEGKLTYYGPQGNVLGGTGNARSGSGSATADIQPSSQPTPPVQYSRQNRRGPEASANQPPSSSSQTSSRSTQSWPPPPPTVNLQDTYSPEPDRTTSIASGYSSQTDSGSRAPSSSPRRASSTTLLYSPLQTADSRQLGQQFGSASGSPSSSGVSLQNVDGSISGFVYGPHGVQRLGPGFTSAQLDPAGGSYSYSTQRQSSSGSPMVSSASQSFQTINGEGVAVFNNNGNQRAYRVTTSGLQPLELSPAQQQSPQIGTFSARPQQSQISQRDSYSRQSARTVGASPQTNDESHASPRDNQQYFAQGEIYPSSSSTSQSEIRQQQGAQQAPQAASSSLPTRIEGQDSLQAGRPGGRGASAGQETDTNRPNSGQDRSAQRQPEDASRSSSNRRVDGRDSEQADRYRGGGSASSAARQPTDYYGRQSSGQDRTSEQRQPEDDARSEPSRAQQQGQQQQGRASQQTDDPYGGTSNPTSASEQPPSADRSRSVEPPTTRQQQQSPRDASASSSSDRADRRSAQQPDPYRGSTNSATNDDRDSFRRRGFLSSALGSS